MKSGNTNITAVLTDLVLSFPTLCEPTKADENSKPRYSASFLIDGSDNRNLSILRAAVKKAAELKWPKGVPKKTEYCLRDAGDKAGKYDGYEEGNYYLSTARAEKMGAPLCVNGRKERMDREEILQKLYGGAIVNAKVSIYAMEHRTGGPMVNASLEVVQFVRDGKPFGGSHPTVDDMPEVTEEASEPLTGDSSLE